MLISAQSSCLVVVDIQERLNPAVTDPWRVIRNASLLMRAARKLSVPILITEQYPRGIGPTVPDLRALAGPEEVVEKIHFSAAAEPAVMERVEALGRRQLVLCGTEAHVCVLQSALGFAAAGYEVFVAADACGSRNEANAQAAFERMRRNGVEVVTWEMVAFEWLHRAGTAEFKDVIQLIK